MPSIFVGDGFDLDTTLPAFLGFPAIRFKYRPALPERVYEYLHACRGSGSQHFDATVKLLAEHLIEWDATDRNGNRLPPDERTLRGVAHPVLERLAEYVTSYTPAQREADRKN